MTEREQEFLRRLRATFKVEAEEHVQAMSAGLVELEKPGDPAAQAGKLESIFRHAHSLKGAARAINDAEVEALCQALEDVFAAGKSRTFSPSPEDFDALHRSIDLIGKLVQSAGAARPAEEKAPVTAMRRALADLIAGDRRPHAAPGPASPALSSPAPAKATPPSRPAPAPVPAPRAAEPVETKAVASEPTVRPAPAETVRISTQKLDRLLLQAEEMLAAKQSARLRASELRELEGLFAQLTKRWAALEPRVRAAAGSDWNFGEVKVLEEKLRALRKSAAQDEHVIGKQVSDLLADSKSLVMLPFSTLSDLFPKLVRDLSRDQGKEAELAIEGGEVEMDKRVLEEMKDPLIHLLRNCVDHGIEPPARRAAQGKPARAALTVAVAPADGNRIEIRIADDGAGIDLDRVKEAAVRHGLVTPDHARQLPDQEALGLIFLSAVSTSPMITEISGRGLGLAIVREKTEKLGGRVQVESRRQIGTTFRIVLPAALSTFHGILVRLRDQTLVIPTASVERVARIRTTDIRTVENRETVPLDGRVVSLARLEEVLELPREAKPQAARDFQPVVVVGAGADKIAFVVDEVLHDEEVLVKRLVRPLSRVRNVASATVLASGRVAVILNPADLVKSARRLAGVPARAAVAPAAAPGTKSLLLVEDSITSRMLLKAILESAGYQVRTAADGIEALTALRTGDFDLVVSDVEMPRMNGFDLTASIRADKRLADKPVILVTALASQADREHGVDVGASAYIVKGSFDQSNLLEAIRRLVR